ncbi:MAG: tripartite tricarboxylate transporter TctB family protein [Hyphomicrobiales bacterium]
MALPETVLGLGVCVVALIAAWQAYLIPVSPLYAKIGPTVFPYMGSAVLLGLGVLLVWQGIQGGWQPDDEKEVPLDWRALGAVGAGLVANVILIGPLGFTVASTVMFTFVAWGFGSRAPWRDAPIGFVLALTAYFGFAGALGVNIGMGPLERALGAIFRM